LPERSSSSCGRAAGGPLRPSRRGGMRGHPPGCASS
jgi:hypothetical protein